jgi:type I restriction enzyme M protein
MGIKRTERTNNQKLVEWINEIIAEKNLPIGGAEQETTGPDRSQPDIIIRMSQNSSDVLCVMELKNPAFLDVFQEEELVEPARKKATRRRAPYFCTSNFRELVLFNTAKANQLESLEKQIIQRYTLSDADYPDDIANRAVQTNIRRGLERFLLDLVGIVTGQIAEPRHPVDEILVMRLQATIRALSIQYREIIENNANSDKIFAKDLSRWFVNQGWSFSRQKEDYEKAARQTAYLLVNKILFYSAIQPIRRLDVLQAPKDLTRGSLLKMILQAFFDEVLKVDYQTIFSTDFIDQIAFPENYDVVREIKELVNVLSVYDFSKIGYDILGRIFERLIPDGERQLLGQYFTNPDVVDIILRFTIRNEKDTILDPGCGAGTFLVRAYQQKKLMNQRLTHEALLKDIWGVDISRFPAHLATINLAINDLRSNENYPRVIRSDFFDLMPGHLEFGLPTNSHSVQIGGLSDETRNYERPKTFDVIAGNPPYTRHLQIEDIQDKIVDYKGSIRQKALNYLNGKKFADISKRAGIYAYFFVHGTKFLANGGRFGFIVSNSWLDADYGKGLQHHFLEHYKIVAIIESRAERWFADADINTCIVILEKASGEECRGIRDDNWVRFVYLKKPLRHFIPAAHNMWDKEIARGDAIDALIRTILGHSSYYENDELRIFPKKQGELWSDGFDKKGEKYIGTKWGIYVRAPEIFFKVLPKIEKKLILLSDLGEVNEGKPTGAEEFFFVKKDIASKFKIEKRYLRHGLRETKGNLYFELRTEHLQHYFLTANLPPRDLKGTGAYSYIRHGERLKIHTRNTYQNKEHWYRFGTRKPADMILSCGIGSRHYCIRNSAKAISSGKFTEIRLNDIHYRDAVWLFLNSAIGWLFVELSGRSGMGGGMLKVDPTDIRKMRVLNPKYFKPSKMPKLQSILKRQVGTVEDESKAEDRLMIDKYIMGDILGLTADEQEEIRRSVVELVHDRHQKAGSVKNGKRPRNGIDLEKLSHDAINRTEMSKLIFFIKNKIMPLQSSSRNLPVYKGNTALENTLLGWRVKSGASIIDCESELEARYIRIFMEMGWETAPIPTKAALKLSLVKEFEKCFERVAQMLEELNSSILQRRIRDRFTRIFWAHLPEMIRKEE